MAQLIFLPGIGANHLVFSKTLAAFPEGEGLAVFDRLNVLDLFVANLLRHHLGHRGTFLNTCTASFCTAC